METATSQTRKDEIVLAAVSAFASRTRPTRLEANQLEDLVLPTLAHTSEQTRRMAAACLSDLPHAPHRLVLRLCEEKADICAALLLRSPVLQDADLTALIEKNGLVFARVIARRSALTEKLRSLLLTLGDASLATIITAGNAAVIHPEIKADRSEISEKLEAARNALRRMMREQDEVPLIAQTPAQPAAKAQTAAIAERPSLALPPREHGQSAAKLRRTALMGDASFFVTALADVHGLSFERAGRIIQRATPSELIMALHAGGVATADAFIITTAFYPSLAREKSEIALFLLRYEGMVRDQSADNVRRWKAEEISTALRAKPANFASLLPQRELKAG